MPTRQCIVCRERCEKNELVRLVSTDGSVSVDPQGKAPGRGAYVHPKQLCIAGLVRRGCVARALRVSGIVVSPEQVQNLERQIRRVSVDFLQSEG